MSDFVIRDVVVADAGTTFQADVLVRGGIIERIALEGIGNARSATDMDAKGRLLLPGVIDDQVHFREPGLTHKEDIAHATAASNKCSGEGPALSPNGGGKSAMMGANNAPKSTSNL